MTMRGLASLGSFGQGGAQSRRGFDLLRWFAVLSLACVIASGAGTAIFLARFLTDHMLQRDAEVSAEFLQSIVRAERTWSWFSDPASNASRLPLESFFNHVSQLPGVVRANVYGVDGTVLWSSNAEIIGRRFERNDELDGALRGRITVESGTLAKAEHVALDRDSGGRRFTEAYLPVWNEARNRVVGVVEIYRLPDALFRAIDEGVRGVWIAAALGMALLYAALFGIAARARRLMVRQQQALVEAEALGAVGAVASAVAHGIRNPLSSIRSSAELGAIEDAEGARRCLADIEREADRVDRWVRDLLMQARGEAVAPAAVDVNLLVAESARSFAAAASRQGVALRVATAELPPARTVAGALGQAIDNLVANAIEAMPEGGRLDLSTALAPGGSHVEIVIADTGGGLPEDVRDGGRMFFSTKPRGTGLGLVLTRRILERHDGSLALESGPGGTRAVIRLPVAAGG
jgi:two-component system sensor histidine kinase HydH